MVNYWEAVANSLSANPYVMGFDPFNEPAPAFQGLAGMVDTFLPGQFD
jgi:hypothetical protein